MKKLELKQYLDVKGRYYIVNSKKEKLGDIYFYSDWKKYVFEPEMCIIFSWDCLKQISDMVKAFPNHKVKHQEE